MADDNVIGIKFGVLGEDQLEGVSGKLIKKQLEEIAQQITLKVKVEVDKDNSTIKSDLEKIKKEANASFNGGGKKIAANYAQVEKALDKVYSTQTKINKSREGSYNWERAKSQIENQKTAYEGLLGELEKVADADDERVKSIKTQFNLIQDCAGIASDIDVAKLKNKSESLFTANGFDKIIARSNEAKKVANDFQELVVKATTRVDNQGKSVKMTKAEVAELNVKYVESETAIKKIGRETNSLWSKVKEAFNNSVVQKLAGLLLSGVIVKALRQVYSNVVKLDGALTNLQIATGYTREKTAELLKTYASLGKQLGATMLEVADAADTWLRQGYSVEESNQLIANSMMLAKLGQLSSTEAATALTSAMKGYKVSVEDSIRVVDKFTAVDMEAAVSAGDIATAMAETAAGADVAGVSMDRLIGYIATVAEVTQDGAESVGTFYKTLFARMGNVKAGNFVDDETGESLNDVESVLGAVGISLRDSKSQFRDFSAVLDDVAQNWENYNSVQQHALATAFAGTRQQEKFIVLMENYGDALNYAATATNSAGTAQSKYDAAYLDSIDAKVNQLTASWQEFSSSVLNSDLIKGAVSFLTGIVDFLTKLSDFSDGMLVTIPAITLSLLALDAILLQIKNAAIVTTMVESGKKILSVLQMLGYSAKAWLLNKYAMITATNTATDAHLLEAAAIEAKTKAQEAYNATNPLAIAIVFATAAYIAIKAYKEFIVTREEANQAAMEEAEAAKELADKAKEEKNSLDDLIDKYAELRDTEYIDADKRKEIRDIQKQINLLVGGEIGKLDLVNDGLETSLKNLRAIKLEQARQKQSTFVASYTAAENSVDNAYVSDLSDSGRAKWIDERRGYDITAQGSDEAGLRILQKTQGVWATDPGVGSSERLAVIIRASGAEGSIRTIDNAIKALEDDQTYDHYNSAIYSKLVQMRNAYQEYVDSASTAASELLVNTVDIAGLQKEVEGGSVVNSIESYEHFKKTLEETVSAADTLRGALSEGRITQQNITEAVGDYMATNFPDWYNKITQNARKAIVAQKDFLKILGEIEEEFNALEKALKDIDQQGIVSASTIQGLLESYPELEKYFKLTSGGYVLADNFKGLSSFNVLEMYTKEYLQTYVDELAECIEGTENYETAQDNLNNAIAVCATLLRTQAIEDATENYERQKDALEENIDKYKELIDIRKELLQTYEEEVDYQKTLAQKQKTVADLQSQLVLSQLDKSAAGQAKTRQLQEELTEAQEDLDDFTLEKAIDSLISDLDSQYSEYERFIDKKLNEIEDAISNLKLTIGTDIVQVPEPSAKTNEGSSASGVYAFPNGRHLKFQTIASIYHTGGFVGGDSTLKSNEEFAKLLKGEFVSTPKQIDAFMKNTLPGLANPPQGVSIEYNSPLIEIKCDNVTENSLPQLNDIINKAAEKIKKDMTNALSRTGYRKQY